MLLRFIGRHVSWRQQRRQLSGPRSGQTLLDKLWSSHVVAMRDEKTAILYVDRHLVHELTSPQAFEGLALAKRPVRRPDCTLCTVDHNVPTTSRRALHSGAVSVDAILEDDAARKQVRTLEENVERFGVPYFGMMDPRQGVVHVVGPEQGFTLPGTTIVCGDSHTTTHGAFGALAFGIGTSEVEHVLATQTILQQKPGAMLVTVEGALRKGVTSKDLILYLVGRVGAAGCTGTAVEFAGSAVRALSMEARMSMCNMAIEAGARAGFVAPDETTFAYVKGRPMAPASGWDEAVEHWRSLRSDDDAHFDVVVEIDAEAVPPMVTWGTSPQDVVPIDGRCPGHFRKEDDASKRTRRALEYVGLTPGQALLDLKLDAVFIGSCTNGRIEDLRAAADVVRSAPDQRVPAHVQALVVPASGLVKLQAEAEGLDEIFLKAGFQWREPGCSMCLGMNPDKLMPYQRCASTSNRNFEGRQGRKGRTHLCSPQTAAASALRGALADVRTFPLDVSTTVKEEDRCVASILEQSAASTTLPQRRRVVNKGPVSGTTTPDGSSRDEGDFASKRLVRLDKVVAAPLALENVDTDMIISKEYLKTVKRTGLGYAAFADLRYENPGDVARGFEPVRRADFVLNDQAYANVRVLVCGDNFGCGSSREHAPWALKDAGILVMIAPSFADIFSNNCVKNGMLPVTLPPDAVDELMAAATRRSLFTVDVRHQTIQVDDARTFSFDLDPFRKHCLLEGLDDVALTLQYSDDIDRFEDARSQQSPWLDGAATSAAAEISISHARHALGLPHVTL